MDGPAAAASTNDHSSVSSTEETNDVVTWKLIMSGVVFSGRDNGVSLVGLLQITFMSLYSLLIKTWRGQGIAETSEWDAIHVIMNDNS